MAITISSSFDAGNIRVVGQSNDQFDLEIVKDHLSDFYQWFYFRLAGAAGRCEDLKCLDREVPLGKDVQELLAHGAGGSDDGDVHGHGDSKGVKRKT